MGSGGSRPLLCRGDDLICRKRRARDSTKNSRHKSNNNDLVVEGGANASSIFSTYETRPTPQTGGKNAGRSFHEALVRERDKKVDFDDIYQVMNEIGNGGLCKIYRVQKYEDKIGGSSRPEGVRRKKFHRVSNVRRSIGLGGLVGTKSVQTLTPTGSAFPRPVSAPTLISPSQPSEGSSAESSNHNIPPSRSGGGIPENAASDSSGAPRPDDVPDENFSELTEVPPRPEQLNQRASTEPGSLTATPSSSVSFILPSVEKGPNMFFALKVINLALVEKDKIDQLKNEVEILKTLDHKNIIKAYETFQMRKYKKLMIVMELCTGGDMHARMPYTERQVANAMRQVLSAISYMHSKRIIHRDIKLENILWESKHPEAAIKVIDFGLSKVFSPNNNVLTERVGTLYSMSPETMKGIYTTQADLWSIGVCTYIMLSMNRPFDGQTPKQLVANVLQCNYEFTTKSESNEADDEKRDVWTTISEQAKSFISQLLVLEPLDRLTADTAKNHEWFDSRLNRKSGQLIVEESSEGVNGQTATTSYELNEAFNIGAPLETDDDEEDDDLPPLTTEEFKNRVRANIVQYADMGEFRRLALNVVAKKSTSSEIFELRKVFDEFDTLNTGTITLDEFKAALSHFEYSEKEIKKIFRKVDVNKNNVINYTEFLAATLETQGNIEEYRLAEAFDVLDSDDSGYISRDNLKKLLGNRAKDDKYIDRLIAEADIAKNGQISYQEFLQVFNRKQHDNIQDIYQVSGSHEEETAAEEVLQRHGIAVSPESSRGPNSPRSLSPSRILENGNRAGQRDSKRSLRSISPFKRQNSRSRSPSRSFLNGNRAGQDDSKRALRSSSPSKSSSDSAGVSKGDHAPLEESKERHDSSSRERLVDSGENDVEQIKETEQQQHESEHDKDANNFCFLPLPRPSSQDPSNRDPFVTSATEKVNGLSTQDSSSRPSLSGKSIVNGRFTVREDHT